MTRSPTCTGGLSDNRTLGVLDRALGSWLYRRVSCWACIRSVSTNGSWAPVTWSLRVHISVVDVYWFVLPVPLPLDTTIGAVDRVGKSVVDLGWIPSSPVSGYRLGSRESVRLGRFHLSRDSLSYPSTRELGRRVSCVVSLCILVCITCALTARHYNWRWATSGIVFLCCAVLSCECRMYVFAVKSVLDLSRFDWRFVLVLAGTPSTTDVRTWVVNWALACVTLNIKYSCWILS